MPDIRRVAVIGSGVMGGGIAAQVANAGVPVLLFDVTQEAAAAAIPRLLKSGAFMVPSSAKLVTPLGLDTDLEALGSCDWIVEAVVENPGIKQDLYRRIDAVRQPESIVSSNTSTIRLAQLLEGASNEFRRNFLITHFFNPPRLMRLLEIVKGDDTSQDAVDAISDFADRCMGKTIVNCKDRPGFIANRLGCYWMQVAVVEAISQGASVEEADAVMGKPFGIPKTGVFGLADLVGIDLMPHVNASLAAALDSNDAFQAINVPVPPIENMIAAGLTGRKGKGGFYRLNREAGKGLEVIDLATGEYSPARAVSPDHSTSLLQQDNAHGRYARAVMLKTLAYAASLVGDAADDITSIDAAMRLGYNWNWGPFELIDRIGLTAFKTLAKSECLDIPPWLSAAEGSLYRNGAALSADGTYHPLPVAPGIIRLSDVKARSAPIITNSSASLWDLGAGVACLELATKMNTLDPDALALLDRAIDTIPRHHRALVIYSDSPHFSAGVDLNWLRSSVETDDGVRRLGDAGRTVFRKLKYAAFPSVAAVCGTAVGGGCELPMHCSAVQAHAECRLGLVEASLGILPDWGGCGEVLLRLQADPSSPKGPMPAIQRAFELLTLCTVSTSAAHAMELGLLRASDGITMNRGRLLADAKAKALSLADGHQPPKPPVFHLPGSSALAALQLVAESFVRLGKATAHDLDVAMVIAAVLTGGGTDITKPVTEDELAELEREGVLRLARSPATQARIRHMIATRKPLRN
jgi:3-hydroxyacyl-CoA dehydrogenase